MYIVAFFERFIDLFVFLLILYKNNTNMGLISKIIVEFRYKSNMRIKSNPGII
jgi:hypothetical protein